MAKLVVVAKKPAFNPNPKRRGPLPGKFGSLQRAKPTSAPKLNFELTKNGKPANG